MNQKTLTNNLQQEIGDIGHNITDAIGRAISASIMASGGETSARTQPATPTVATPKVTPTPKTKRTQATKAKANDDAIAKAKAKLAALEQEIVEQTMAAKQELAIEQAREREQIRQGQQVQSAQAQPVPEPIVDPLGIVDGIHVAPGIVLTAIDNETQTIALRISFAVGAKIANKSGSYQLYAHTVSQGLQARRGGYCPLGNSGLSLSLKLAKFAN